VQSGTRRTPAVHCPRQRCAAAHALLARGAASRTRSQQQLACGGVVRLLLAALAPALARAQVPATGCLAATGTIGAVAAMGGCSVTMTMYDTWTGNTPLTIGVNLGHHHPDDGTWVAFLEHLGVNGARASAAVQR
jgi:hypothetical protein